MAGLVYTGKFEKNINHLYSHENVKDTARKLAEHEKAHGPYEFGKNFTKVLIPKTEDWTNDAGSTEGHTHWEKHAGSLPTEFRKKITELISTNLKSASPMPMMFKVGENVDGTHDLIIKTFAYKGHVYIGLLVLCPNTKL
jgi:hypothetical protein